MIWYWEILGGGQIKRSVIIWTDICDVTCQIEQLQGDTEGENGTCEVVPASDDEIKIVLMRV